MKFIPTKLDLELLQKYFRLLFWEVELLALYFW